MDKLGNIPYHIRRLRCECGSDAVETVQVKDYHNDFLDKKMKCKICDKIFYVRYVYSHNLPSPEEVQKIVMVIKD